MAVSYNQASGLGEVGIYVCKKESLNGFGFCLAMNFGKMRSE